MNSSIMRYKDYAGFVEVDTESGLLHGEVLGLRDVITFQAETVDEVKRAFRDSVDDYLEWCRELGEKPEKPFSGRFQLRLSPETHRNISIASKASAESINSWVTKWIQRGLQEELGSST